MKVRIAQSAAADLDEIWAFIAKIESIAAAERLVNSLADRFSLLAKNPAAGRNRFEIRTGAIHILHARQPPETKRRCLDRPITAVSGRSNQAVATDGKTGTAQKLLAE